MAKKYGLTELAEALSKPQNTIILFHKRPDADAVGSAFALRLILESAGSDAYCLCEDEIPKRLAFLSEGIQNSALEDSLPEKFRNNTRVIAVDSGSANQLGVLYERFRPDYMIDHHMTGERYADGVVVPTAAATGYIVYRLLLEITDKKPEITVPERVYGLIYAAISSDTGCFRFSNTTPETHRCAAELLLHGIDAADINHRLFECKTYSQLEAEKIAVELIKTAHNGKIAYVAADNDVIKKSKINKEDFDAFIEVARSVEGAVVAFSVRHTDEESGCRVSMRSACDVNVASVCAKFGGGGHIRAAGCTVDTDDIDYAVSQIIAETEEQLV